MTTQKLPWKEAAFHVLAQAAQPLHYTEVGDRIAQQKLTKSFGANPGNQANGYLHDLVKEGRVVKVSPGVFALPDSETAEKLPWKEAAFHVLTQAA